MLPIFACLNYLFIQGFETSNKTKENVQNFCRSRVRSFLSRILRTFRQGLLRKWNDIVLSFLYYMATSKYLIYLFVKVLNDLNERYCAILRRQQHFSRKFEEFYRNIFPRGEIKILPNLRWKNLGGNYNCVYERGRKKTSLFGGDLQWTLTLKCPMKELISFLQTELPSCQLVSVTCEIRHCSLLTVSRRRCPKLRDL